jgi:site-specific DNA recombinase
MFVVSCINHYSIQRTMSTRPATKSSPSKRCRCAIYTRVSTDDQARGDYSSLKSQKDICEHYVSVHQMDGWVATSYFEDPGYSGKNMDRPGIQALIGEINAGNVDVVVTYKIDRITRSLPDFYDFWRMLERHHVNFASATQNFDTATPMGMLMLNMLLSFGQFERELTVERTTHKLAERAKRGKWNGGWVPLGYKYDKATQLLKPHPEEADLVREMYRLAKTLRNATQVAKILNRDGRRTRQRVLIRKDGSQKLVGEKRFISDRIRACTGNPLYKGIILHNGVEYPSEHPGLVSPKLWQEANEALLPIKNAGTRFQMRDKHVHLLKGLLKCGHCGTALTPFPSGKKDKNGNPHLYYTCTNVIKDGRAAECLVRSIPARDFEKLIIGYIGELGRHPEIIQATVKASNEAKKKSIRPLRSQLAVLEKRYRELSEAVNNCVEAAKRKGARNITDDFMAEAERLAEEKHTVELEREKLRIEIDYREKVVADERAIADALLRFEKVVDNLPPEEQKELLRLIIREIAVKHFDPEKDKAPVHEGVFRTKIRTKWYLVNMSLYASDLFARVSQEGKISSYFDRIGSPGRTRTYNLVINSHSLHH